ncbi:MAG: tetratricopeptide repeat protein, partial [Xanthobacteraceae bacterium]
LGELLVHIEDLRSSRSADGGRNNGAPDADLQQQLARTQSALDAMHSTLGIVVDRLATIEKGVVRGEARPAGYDDALELTEPVGRIAARVVTDEPAAPVPPAPREMHAPLPDAPKPQPIQPAPELAAALAPQPPRPAPQPQAAPQQPQQQARRLPPAPRLPINPELPPDQPLEPGTVPPRFGSPGARIAASEAALGGVGPKGDNGPTGKSGFIAAARRAAQAAMVTGTPRAPRADEIEALSETGETPSLRASVFKKIKQVLIAASLVAIVIAGIQFASKVFHFGGTSPNSEQNAPADNSNGAPKTSDNGAAAPQAPASDDALVTHSVTAPAKPIDLPGYLMGPSGTIRNVTPGYKPSYDSSSLLSAPALNPPAPATVPSPDVTGSIPAAPKAKAVAPQADNSGLPASIGSDKLREAAAAGDAGAAFEVAQRFAEGRGVAASLEEAARWYERAAGKGLVAAQFRYASMLEKGQGVKKNLGQARKLYIAAAGKGHAKAMHNLAVLYAEGIDGRPDYTTAAQWFRKAADHGVADSQYNLGVLCARGLGVEKSLTDAYQWFALAAAQGDHEAGKKRDEIASRLEPDELTAAQNAVKMFKAHEQPAAATAVPVPRGGWDATGNAAPAAPKGHVQPRAVPQAVTNAAPLNIGAVARR